MKAGVHEVGRSPCTRRGREYLVELKGSEQLYLVTCGQFPSGPQKHEYKPKDIST